MEVSVQELEKWEQGSYRLIDMRSAESLNYGTIPGAEHIDAERLKGPLAGLFDRVFFLFFRKEIQSLFDHFPKFRGGIYAVALTNLIGDGFGDLLTVRLIGILIQHSGKFFSGNGIQTLRRTDSCLLIQS